MVIKTDQLVVKYFDDTPVMAWVKELTSRPGEVAVLCVTIVEDKEVFFESDLESLEVVDVQRQKTDSLGDHHYL